MSTAGFPTKLCKDLTVLRKVRCFLARPVTCMQGEKAWRVADGHASGTAAPNFTRGAAGSRLSKLSDGPRIPGRRATVRATVARRATLDAPPLLCPRRGRATLASVSLVAPPQARAQTRSANAPGIHQQQAPPRSIHIASPSQWSSQGGSSGGGGGRSDRDDLTGWGSSFVRSARRRYTRSGSPHSRTLSLPYGSYRWVTVATVFVFLVWAVLPSGSGSKGTFAPRGGGRWWASGGADIQVSEQHEYEHLCTRRSTACMALRREGKPG